MPRHRCVGTVGPTLRAGPLRPQRLRRRPRRPAGHRLGRHGQSGQRHSPAPTVDRCADRHPGPCGTPSAAARPSSARAGASSRTEPERLASPGPRPRTFVAYDAPAGAPRTSSSASPPAWTYHDLAALLAGYFPRYDATRAADAMCLDGGASTQFSYRRREAPCNRPATPAWPFPMPSSCCLTSRLGIFLARPP